jgi:hypothetical protein
MVHAENSVGVHLGRHIALADAPSSKELGTASMGAIAPATSGDHAGTR